jgi:LytS/YehU family sensor histidine kinase
LSGLAATIITTSIVLFMGMYLHKYSFKQNLIPLKLNLTYAWLVNLLYHLINTVIFYFKEYKISQHQAETFRKLNAQAELQIVKNQINPHFLFNNLNVLSTLVLQNNDEANKFIEEFSKVYRYILYNQEKDLVDLKTELYFIRPYIFLLEKRFGKSLIVEININEINHHKYIIPAALQMLIENAIKHNIISNQKPLNIKISINKENHIVVTNNLQFRQSSEPSTHIGLKNIIKRYQLVAEEKVIVEDAMDFFSVTIPLINVAKKDYEYNYN